MAKKRFTEGLDSLFEESSPPSRQGKGRSSSSSASPRRRSSGKDFSDDLSSLLQEAFEESFEEQVEKKKNPSDTEDDKALNRPLTGLDALIRNTLEPAAVTIDPKARRRLVVSFHEDQLSKLKAIARLKKTRLKQIIHTIVEGYIEQYEEEKGDLP